MEMVKGGAFAIFAVHGDRSVVGFHHACHIGESDAHAAHIVHIACVYAIEAIENAFQIFFLYAQTVIRNTNFESLCFVAPCSPPDGVPRRGGCI